MRTLGLKRRENESPIEEIIHAYQTEMASGSGLIIGIRPMQYMLQTKYKRTVTR